MRTRGPGRSLASDSDSARLTTAAWVRVSRPAERGEFVMEASSYGDRSLWWITVG